MVLLICCGLIAGCATRPVPEPDVRLFISAPANSLISNEAVRSRRYRNGNIRSITFSAIGESRSADLQWAVEWYQADERRAPGISDRWRNFGTTAGLPFSTTAIAPNDGIVSALIKIRTR